MTGILAEVIECFSPSLSDFNSLRIQRRFVYPAIYYFQNRNNSAAFSRSVLHVFLAGCQRAVISPIVRSIVLEFIPYWKGKLIFSIVTSMIKSVVVRGLFRPKESWAELIYHLPMILLAAAIRGFIIGLVKILLKSYGFCKKNIFYNCRFVKYTFEPLVKKLEVLPWDKALKRSFSLA